MSFADILQQGAILCGTGGHTAADVKTVLGARLQRYRTAVGRPAEDTLDLDALQLQTSQEALDVLLRAQRAALQECVEESLPVESDAPASAIGTRDLATIRILLSLVFKWGIEPSYTRLREVWPVSSTSGAARMVELADKPPDAHKLLTSLVLGLSQLVYPRGVTGDVAETAITSTLYERHLADLIRSSLALGWLPKSLASPTVPVIDELRPMIMRLLTRLSSFQTILALGRLMEDTPTMPTHARKACASLLSRQVLRPDGLHGLYSAVFGTEDHSQEEAPVEKLEQVYRVLSTVPAHLTPASYMSIIIPRLISDLNATTKSPTFLRASSFVLSRMVTSTEQARHLDLAINVITQTLHGPFKEGAESTSHSPSASARMLDSPESAIAAMVAFFANCDPSPSVFSSVLSPVVPALYSIVCVLREKKVVDPLLLDSANGLLASWGRVTDANECVEVLWTVIQDYDDTWRMNEAGYLMRSTEASTMHKLAMFTPHSLRQAEEAGEFDVDANVMNLRPDPAAFVAFVKSTKRPNIASELFVLLLEAYQAERAASTDDPLKALLFLQLIVQMQTFIPPGSSQSDILKKPEHLLSFIKSVLKSAGAEQFGDSSSPGSPGKKFASLGFEDLRIVEEKDDELAADSDDEDADTADEEMIATAINLLLSLLENHPKLSIRNAPILNDIFELLERLTLEGSETVRPLARESRIVISARLASTSASEPTLHKKLDEGEDAQETYQRALKLLQDPILPVRAHGLLLLRQLVSKSSGIQASSKDDAAGRVFLPAVLSIFQQSLQDDDSYIYLNAVQGLSAMVDTFGREILSSLVSDYSAGLDSAGSATFTQSRLDHRLRIGEALGQVIRRCGSALSAYADLIVPRIFAVARASYLPTSLRMSAISLLATCASTYFLAVLAYAADLADAVTDMLQLQAGTASQTSAVADMDDNPTSTGDAFAPMRRSTLHLLSLLLRGCLDGHAGEVFHPALIRRMRIVLSYLATTDIDSIVKVQAREALEAITVLEGMK